MECGICLELFDSESRQPMILDCKHSLCKECLNSLFRKPVLECPFDRKPITKPLSKIKPNVSMQKVLTWYTKSKTSQISAQTLITEENKEETKTAKKTFCSAMHELIFNQNSSADYKKKRNSRKITCEWCRKTWIGGSWHCNICTVDHCNDCYKEQTDESAVYSSITCKHQHKLCYFKDNTQFYIRKISNQGEIMCGNCSKIWKGSSWSCRKCGFDICENAARQLFRAFFAARDTF
jgi:hypothetical protein